MPSICSDSACEFKVKRNLFGSAPSLSLAPAHRLVATQTRRPEAKGERETLALTQYVYIHRGLRTQDSALMLK